MKKDSGSIFGSKKNVEEFEKGKERGEHQVRSAGQIFRQSVGLEKSEPEKEKSSPAYKAGKDLAAVQRKHR